MTHQPSFIAVYLIVALIYGMLMVVMHLIYRLSRAISALAKSYQDLLQAMSRAPSRITLRINGQDVEMQKVDADERETTEATKPVDKAKLH